MRQTVTMWFAVVALAVLAGTAGVAGAQCGGFAKGVRFDRGTAPQSAFLKRAAFDGHDFDGFEPVVGLWKVDFEDPSKGYSDKGYQVWHSDHTEFLNSGRIPSTGAVCQGVWTKTGKSTFKLNHFALAYNGTVAAGKDGVLAPNEKGFANIIQIKEDIVVDESRKSFHGTFVADVYDPAHHLLVSFKGPITGERITMDTTIDSQ